MTMIRDYPFKMTASFLMVKKYFCLGFKYNLKHNHILNYRPQFWASITWGKSARFRKKWPTVCNSFFTNSRSIYFGPFSTFQFGGYI